MSLVKKLLNDDDFDNITLEDEDGKSVEFEQYGVLCDEENGGKNYALLHPLLDGCEEGELVIFYIDEKNDRITIEEDKEVCQRIFDAFVDGYDDEEEE